MASTITSPGTSHQTPNRLLLAAVFGPYGVKDEYAEALGMQMELLNNQITREQGVHSPRQSYWSFGLYLLAANISVPTTVLDFPSWDDFTQELKKGYTHVGITFIVPNVYKVKRMTAHIRQYHPDIKIILGGYGTVIPDLDTMVSYDAICKGEGVRWLRKYFNEDTTAPINHPAIAGPAYQSIYGFRSKPKGAVLLSGVGCENGCKFCITSHQFKKKYIPLLETGKDVFDACRRAEKELGTTGFSIMDENFLKKPERAKELLEEMTRHNKAYVFDIFSSAEVIQQVGVDFLVRLGVRMVWVGVESKVNTHAKTRGIDLPTMIHELQSHGIIVNSSTILFQDHHDRQQLAEEIDWVIGLKSDLVQFMNYTPFPTTALYQGLKAENRMKNVDYRHHHGQGELLFDHPHINDPADHIRYLKNAFNRKYQTDGPSVVSMALTAIRGYSKAKQDYAYRRKNSLIWNPESFSYEAQKPGRNGQSSADPQPDKFMEKRLRKMEKIAINIRPVLAAAWLLAPNWSARKKAARAMALYQSVLGRPVLKDRVVSAVLCVSGIKEALKMSLFKAMGRDIVCQPPVKKTMYNGLERKLPANEKPYALKSRLLPGKAGFKEAMVPGP